jgi:hypothetical protein
VIVATPALLPAGNRIRSESIFSADGSWTPIRFCATGRHDARAITNREVVDMAQNRVSDEVICNAIRTRGGRFNTTPESIVTLKNSGVSDRVIEAMQNNGGY